MALNEAMMQQEHHMDFLKVSSKSSPASVAGAIAGMVKDGVPVNLQSVGAGAVNQAIKAIAIARGFLIPTEIDMRGFNESAKRSFDKYPGICVLWH